MRHSSELTVFTSRRPDIPSLILAAQAAYDAACRLEHTGPSTCHPLADDEPGTVAEVGGYGPGVRVGHYRDCEYVASGATARVYRHNDRALKVIVETRNLEPHSPSREAKILALLKKPCIPLLETFRDHEQRLVLVFPYMPLTLAGLLDRRALPRPDVRSFFQDIFTALNALHNQGIIHRDIKPSAVLLASPTGPAYLSDFGSAWHPALSVAVEPIDKKVLDIGTGPYRAPEVLFGYKSYGPPVDMWAAGAMLAECCRHPPRPLFESRAVHEDGNQLGLILSIFKTLGSPTRETWPEAASFRTPPFDMYQPFEKRPWHVILPEMEPDWCELIASLVKYDSSRATAAEVGALPIPVTVTAGPRHIAHKAPSLCNISCRYNVTFWDQYTQPTDLASLRPIHRSMPANAIAGSCSLAARGLCDQSVPVYHALQAISAAYLVVRLPHVMREPARTAPRGSSMSVVRRITRRRAR